MPLRQDITISLYFAARHVLIQTLQAVNTGHQLKLPPCLAWKAHGYNDSQWTPLHYFNSLLLADADGLHLISNHRYLQHTFYSRSLSSLFQTPMGQLKCPHVHGWNREREKIRWINPTQITHTLALHKVSTRHIIYCSGISRI